MFDDAVVAVDSDDERHAGKAQRQHATTTTHSAASVVLGMKVTSDRKRKWSNVDDDRRCRSRDGRCEHSVDCRSAVGAVTASSSAGDVVRPTRSTAAAEPIHDEPEPERQVRDARAQTASEQRRSENDDQRLSSSPSSRLPLDVVWHHKNWSSVGAAPRLLVEPSRLCRESFLHPVLLLNGTTCCQLSN